MCTHVLISMYVCASMFGGQRSTSVVVHSGIVCFLFCSPPHPSFSFLFFFSFLKTASHYVAEASLKLREIHLPLPPKFWDSWHASAYQPTCDTTGFTSSSLFCLFVLFCFGDISSWTRARLCWWLVTPGNLPLSAFPILEVPHQKKKTTTLGGFACWCVFEKGSLRRPG